MTSWKKWMSVCACGAGIWWAMGPGFALANLPSAAPPLPAPTGPVVRVSSPWQLENVMPKITSGTTVILEKGIYKLRIFVNIKPGLKNITLRGATGNPNDVHIVGNGMYNLPGNVLNCIEISGAENVTIADLTIRDAHSHLITMTRAPKGVRIYNCHLLNSGAQFIKGNRYNGVGAENGSVEYCTIEYSDRAKSDYTNGVDVHGGTNWIIRHNLFKNIRGPVGKIAGHAILMWNNTKYTIVDSNTLINCDRGIALGLGERSVTEGKYDHVGGIVCNNIVYRASGNPGGVGIYVADCPNAQVYHNTVLHCGTYASGIEYRFRATTNCIIKHNLLDCAITARAYATGTVSANLTTARPSWFVNVGAGNFRLLATSTSAIDKLPVLTTVPRDYFERGRPLGLKADFGAIEFEQAL